MPRAVRMTHGTPGTNAGHPLGKPPEANAEKGSQRKGANKTGNTK
jgi:hypothetical protein